MSVEGVLATARARHRALMRDACDITRAGERTFNPVTGQYEQIPTTVYSGVCRVKPETGASETEAGEEQVAVRRYVLSLPWGDATAAVRVEDVVTLTVSDDPWLVGPPARPLVVISVGYGTDRAARRLIVEDRDA